MCCDVSDVSSNDGDIPVAAPLQRLLEAVDLGEASDVITEEDSATTPPSNPSHPTQRKQKASSSQRKQKRKAEPSTAGSYQQKRKAEPSTAGSYQQKRKKAAQLGTAPTCSPPVTSDANIPADSRAVLEIFGGCMRWTGACIAAGLCVACPIELENGQWCNVEDPRVRVTILKWIEMGLVWFVHIATPCTRHSRARTRGKKQPARPTVVEKFTAEVLRAIGRHGLLFCLENPFRSTLFDIQCIAHALAALHAFAVVFDCCAWGASYWKRTELRTNVPQLKRLERACFDMKQHTHEHLEGTVTFLTEQGCRKTIWKTKLAGKYVPEWCHAYAKILAELAPEQARAHGGKAAWSSSWQAQLVAATGCVTTPPIDAPTCPSRSSCEWAHAVSTWSHRGHHDGGTVRVVKPGAGWRLPQAQQG